MSIYLYVCLILDSLISLSQNMATPDKSGKIDRVFLRFQEAQEFLDVSHQTLYKLMGQGLPSHKIGRKRVFFKEDLIEWIRNH